MNEDLESVIGELRCFANDQKDNFDKKRMNQLIDMLEKKDNTKCSTNMSEPIDLNSIFGEINMIGNRLELWGLDYGHMSTEIWRMGLRLQELYEEYKSYIKSK